MIPLIFPVRFPNLRVPQGSTPSPFSHPGTLKNPIMIGKACPIWMFGCVSCNSPVWNLGKEPFTPLLTVQSSGFFKAGIFWNYFGGFGKFFFQELVMLVESCKSRRFKESL